MSRVLTWHDIATTAVYLNVSTAVDALSGVLRVSITSWIPTLTTLLLLGWQGRLSPTTYHLTTRRTTLKASKMQLNSPSAMTLLKMKSSAAPPPKLGASSTSTGATRLFLEVLSWLLFSSVLLAESPLLRWTTITTAAWLSNPSTVLPLDLIRNLPRVPHRPSHPSPSLANRNASQIILLVLLMIATNAATLLRVSAWPQFVLELPPLISARVIRRRIRWWYCSKCCMIMIAP